MIRTAGLQARGPARLEHSPPSWNQLGGLCPVQQASPERANPIRLNRERFNLIGFRSSVLIDKFIGSCILAAEDMIHGQGSGCD